MENLAYKYDKNGYYTETVARQIDPLASMSEGETVYLMPANSTDVVTGACVVISLYLSSGISVTGVLT